MSGETKETKVIIEPVEALVENTEVHEKLEVKLVPGDELPSGRLKRILDRMGN